ncbi:glycine-rich domain-containing protein, partial [Flavonifractor plautii]|uniref:glycine-rich domain-containing protein n=1 Tax=Flavonifractor plautii TaxID=292800 RepID=UPI003BAB9EC4
SGLEATNVQEAIDELAGKGGGEYLPLTGGTMTGPLTLSGLPTSENHAANKRYVDTSVEQVLGSIGYSLVKEYTSPGSFTHTFDRKYTDIFVIVVGGGGGGGSVCQNGVSSNAIGGGGGAGGFVACFHVLDSTKIKNRNIVVGAGGAGAPAQSERGATGNGGTGSSSSAFGVTVPGGKGGRGSTGGFDEAPNAVGVYSIVVGGNGANGYDESDRRGNNGPVIDILGLTFFSGGGGGGGGGQYSGPRPTGGAGGASGGGSGGSGAITGADATNGSAGSKGGGGGGAGGGFHDGSTTQKSGIGGKGGDGYVAIYGRG